MKLLYSDTQNKYSNHLNESPVAKKRKVTSSLIAGGMTILIFVNILRVNSSIIPNKKFYFLFLILKILLYYIGSYFKYLIKLFNAAYRSRREIQFLTSIFFVFSFFLTVPEAYFLLNYWQQFLHAPSPLFLKNYTSFQILQTAIPFARDKNFELIARKIPRSSTLLTDIY